MSWCRGRLGEFVTLKRGYDLPESRRLDGDVPVVSSSGITGSHNAAKVAGPGVVTGRYGTLGEVFFVERDFWPLNTALYVRDFHGNDPRFVAYFLQHLLGNTQSDKAAVPGVNRNDLHERETSIPDETEQKAIVRVLSAYDDLIENNARRIKLLEDAARLLYEESFVRLRFPGHEHVRVRDGVPEGWVKARLGDLAEIVMGQSPPSSLYNGDGEGLPFHQGVKDFGDRFVTHRVYTTARNRIAEAHDILCSVRAPVGRLNIAPDRLVVGRGLSAMRSRAGFQSFLYYQLKQHFFREDLIGTGAIFASVSKTDLERQELLTPSERLIRAFEEISWPIDRQIRVLWSQNAKLKEARDLLLPRLMSGDIAV